MLLCDKCDRGFHTFCLNPPLRAMPPKTVDWFCGDCQELEYTLQPPTYPSAQHGEPTEKATPLCGLCHTPASSRLITCRSCEGVFHPSCLGIYKSAYTAGEFVCAPCSLLAANVVGPVHPKASAAAHMLVHLKGSRVQESSMDTYASALHRFIHFTTEICGKPLREVMPPGRNGVVSTDLVLLFLGYAATRYKLNTIKVTISALVDWHKSKNAPSDTVAHGHPEIKAVLQSIKVHQGPEGKPIGKVGLPLPMLKLLLRYLHDKQSTEPAMSDLYTRDAVWLCLGFFGMLRRSEIIALRLNDVSFTPLPSPHITLRIRSSKADKASHGAMVVISATSASGVEILRRVAALTLRLKELGAEAHHPLIPAWDYTSYSLNLPVPLANGQALATRLKLHLANIKASYPLVDINVSDYSMHSLRRGGVVAAWQAGVPVEQFKAHGRWASSAVQAYMVPTKDILIGVTASF